MIITSHFLDQAVRGSVPPTMIDALRARDYPPNCAIILGIVPCTQATAYAITRSNRNGKGVVAATCITRYRALENPQVLYVNRVIELKKEG
jgi:hypothetical protein